MADQSYQVVYQAAMDAATVELDGLFEEAKRLRNRMEQIDEAINALKQLLESSEPDTNSYSNQFDSTVEIAAVA